MVAFLFVVFVFEDKLFASQSTLNVISLFSMYLVCKKKNDKTVSIDG